MTEDARKQIYRALAKAIAYHEQGKDAEAQLWFNRHIELLKQEGFDC